MEVKVETPPFASVKIMRVFRRGHEQPGVVFASVILSMQTNAVGKQKGEVKVRLGEQVAKVPFVASVLPPAEGLTKVLVISNGFGSASHRRRVLPSLVQPRSRGQARRRLHREHGRPGFSQRTAWP